MLDLTTGIEIARIPAIAGGDMPKWSIDGNEMAIILYIGNIETLHQEFFSISRSGQAKQLSQLRSFYGFRDYYVGDFNWSPDGRYIAFWLFTGVEMPHDTMLAVLDTQTGMTTNYCIPGGFGTGDNSHSADFAPIWSPDGKQLLVISPDPSDSQNTVVVLVDLRRNLVSKIAENIEPVGWMK